jgi:hypothetical protein
MNNDIPWNDAREARLDRAIDRAVREMMQLDPPPGLRRRVLSRLNAPSERQALPFMRYALAAAAVVAGVLVVPVTRLLEHVEPPTPPRPPAIVVTGAPRVTADLRVAPIGEAPPSAAQGTQITRERIPMPRVTNVFGTRSGEASAATVRSNEPARRTRPQSLAPLTIVPLSARPIVIEPLVIPAPPKGDL